MRLIDADALIEAIDEISWYSFYNGNFVNGAECDEKALYKAIDIFATVDNAPTIEAEPVKHGRWVKKWHDNSLIGHEYEECPDCGCIISDTEKFWDCNYCPNCGAKMDLEG